MHCQPNALALGRIAKSKRSPSECEADTPFVRPAARTALLLTLKIQPRRGGIMGSPGTVVDF